MRSSYDRDSDCGPLLCYLPCLPEPKQVAGSGGPVPGAPAAVAEEKPPTVQKIEDDEGGCKVVPVVAVAPKSSLKRAGCVSDSKDAAVKGNVKWMDLLGKDLTQVKEFEPSESGDYYDDEDASPCTCVIL